MAGEALTGRLIIGTEEQMGYECDNDNHDIGCQCPGVPSTLQRIREVVARTIHTTPGDALKGMAEILHIIDGT